MRKGFTLIELLIVISIIIILVAFTLINIRGQIARANDAKRKSDLYTIHSAMEEYNNDHESFPPAGSIDNCGSTGMSPYLKLIPCDPAVKPYGYFPSASTGGFRVCAVLEDKTDPAIAKEGCGSAKGCGVGGGYNYCLASGTTPSAVGTADEIFGSVPTNTPTPTSAALSTPTPTPTPYAMPTPVGNPKTGPYWVCTQNGACNLSADPISQGCAVWWNTVCPGYDYRIPFSGVCSDPANRCSEAGNPYGPVTR